MSVKRRHSDLRDEQLVAMTAEDPEAFGALYDRFERELLGFFYRATRQPDVAAAICRSCGIHL